MLQTGQKQRLRRQKLQLLVGQKSFEVDPPKIEQKVRDSTFLKITIV
jgi:hypothetical protein